MHPPRSNIVRCPGLVPAWDRVVLRVNRRHEPRLLRRQLREELSVHGQERSCINGRVVDVASRANPGHQAALARCASFVRGSAVHTVQVAVSLVLAVWTRELRVTLTRNARGSVLARSVPRAAVRAIHAERGLAGVSGPPVRTLARAIHTRAILTVPSVALEWRLASSEQGCFVVLG